MDKDRFCPLPPRLNCTSNCGFYSKLDKRCSINLLAEALISLVDLRGRIFSNIMTRGGRVTIPLAIREELNLKDGSLIRLVIVRESEEKVNG